MTATERENRQQSEQLAALQSDKDQLEGALYEAQQTVVQLEVRKAQLEGENQELIVRKENLQGEKIQLFQLDVLWDRQMRAREWGRHAYTRESTEQLGL